MKKLLALLVFGGLTVGVAGCEDKPAAPKTEAPKNEAPKENKTAGPMGS